MVTQSGPKHDPLRRLDRRIEQARQPNADPAPTGELHREEGDPLATLRRRIEDAANPTERRDPPPLSDLLEAFEHARAMLDEPFGYLHDVDADGDPLEQMRCQIRRDADEIGRRGTIELPRAVAPERPDRDRQQTVSAGDGTDAVGRQVLEMLEDRDLDGAVRADAVRRLAGAIETGDRGEMREVLRLLIQG
ncbi:MAG: hypothetical protein ABEN55_17320 [Bradymonadaceae bacterium]